MEFIRVKDCYSYCYRISMSNESLDLLLIMNIPNSDYSVLASTNRIFPIGRNCQTQGLIKVALNTTIVFFSLEYELFLSFKVPYMILVKIYGYVNLQWIR